MKHTVRIFGFLVAVFFTGCLPEVETIDPVSIVEWENYTIADGLAGNRVNAITTDSEGNFWFATDNGVSKYDGTTFTNYRTTDGLVSNFVTSVIEFEPGVMVFGTDIGLSILDNGIWYYLIDIDGSGTPFEVTTLGVDADGLGWIGTDGSGLLLTDGYSFYLIWDDQCAACNYINYIYKDPQDKMWFATAGGLRVLQDGLFTLYDTSDGLPDDYIQSLFEDSWGTLWVGTYNGLARQDGNRFKSVSLYNSAPQNWSYTISQDKRKKVWFGSIGFGLIYYDGTVMRTNQESLRDYRKSTISSYQDMDGVLWFGTFEGGLYKYTPK